MAKIIQGDRVGKNGTLAVGCSAAVFDPKIKKILLVCRADNGRWAVPGGYMEPGESVAEACAREVLEETGLQVQVKELIAVYSTPHRLIEYEDGNRYQLVVLHFKAKPVDGRLSISDETTDAGYFTYKELQELEISDFDQQRIDDAFTEHHSTFIR